MKAAEGLQDADNILYLEEDFYETFHVGLALHFTFIRSFIYCLRNQLITYNFTHSYISRQHIAFKRSCIHAAILVLISRN